MTNPLVNGKLLIQLEDLEAVHPLTLLPTIHFQIHPVPAQIKYPVKQVEHLRPGEVQILAKMVAWLIQSIQEPQLPTMMLNLLQ